MRGIDEIDIEILRVLNEDARRPYSEIADQLDVSQPTVSNRVERLRELGIIHRFTLDLDRSILHDGVSLLIDIETSATSLDAVAQSFEEISEVHTVYTTADAHVITLVVCRPDQVHDLVGQTIPETAYSDYEVKLLTNTRSNPTIRDTEFSVECASCGNRVISENGVTARFDGTLYHFCCERCEDAFTERYDTLRQDA